jgi:hypothetical protein
MISAKELRIGNLVLYEGLILPVIALAEDDIVVNGFGGRSNAFAPIPLTEEILLKCGFVSEFTGHQEDNVMRLNIKKTYSEHDYLGIDYDINVNLLSILQDSDIVCLEHIKYLHQLQNLFYCLSGNELQYNP